jgi:D-3-phosphoglycerate dehydrogenase
MHCAKEFVINTCFIIRISSRISFAHLFSGVRFLHSNRTMPLEGDSNFDGLKKAYANGIELRGKTLGIVGIGRIGRRLQRWLSA